MGQVFGTPRRPAYTVTRTDRLGRPISLGDVLPESKAILFTGPPGMGKSRELDQAEELAARNGWTAIRVEASARDPLENRFTRAIKADLDKLRSRFGYLRVRKTVRDLTQRARNTQHGAEVRVGAAPVQFIAKRQWDVTPQDDIGTTLNDFGDQLGELAASKNQPVMLLVDNVDAASPRDLAGLNELAVHLEQKGRPVWLVAAGGAMATSRLMAASDRMSGIATTVTNQFDIREVGPLSDDELRPFLTEPLDDARIGYQPAAIDSLLRAANGDPSRLRTLAETALAYADRDAGITIAAAAAAVSQVGKQSVVLYQGRWNQCKDAQKDLLAKVAAQGPNGLSMPAETQAAGSGWRDIDTARQLLVARGLLREHDGERVTIAEAGFQDWVNDYLEQTPAPAGPAHVTQALARTADNGAGIAPAHSTGDRALVSQVFGTARTPVHPVDRVDQNAQPISLDRRLPTRTSVLFTGPPGMGTSHELDRAQALADRQGWTAIRLDASPREPLENRVVRAVSHDLDGFRRRFGAGEARKLKKALGELAVRTRNAQHGAEVRVGVPGGFQVVGKRQWDAAPRDTVGSTLNELADHLGELAAKKGEPIMLMVDNLDVASDRDVVALTELSAHLERQGKPVFLVGAGGELATARLLGASGGQAGIETKVAHRFDVREVAPLTEAQLHPALTEPLRQAGIPYEAQAVDSLVKAANGNPSRLRALAGSALELADPQTGITTGVAKAATAQLNDHSRALYEAAWHNCSAAEKELLAKAAVRGPQGLSMPAEAGPSTPGRWDLDTAGQGLISRGLLRKSGQHITVADPGLQDWVQTRLGQAAAHTGLAHPTAPQPQLTAATERPDGRHAHIREHSGRTANR